MDFTIFTANCTGNSKNCRYPNRNHVSCLDDLLGVIRFDHVCAEFENNHRSINNFLESDVAVAMADNMRADLCVETLKNAYRTYPDMKDCIIHSGRGSQYTSEIYRNAISKYGIIQSMNSAGGRCHDNARCESMWARLKEEFIYERYDTDKMTIEELKTISQIIICISGVGVRTYSWTLEFEICIQKSI